LLVSSILVVALGLYALNNLEMNISGDGIPNRPQRGPPLEYPWDQAVPIILFVVSSAITAIYSWFKVSRAQLHY